MKWCRRSQLKGLKILFLCYLFLFLRLSSLLKFHRRFLFLHLFENRPSLSFQVCAGHSRNLLSTSPIVACLGFPSSCLLVHVVSVIICLHIVDHFHCHRIHLGARFFVYYQVFHRARFPIVANFFDSLHLICLTMFLSLCFLFSLLQIELQLYRRFIILSTLSLKIEQTRWQGLALSALKSHSWPPLFLYLLVF